MAIQQNLETPTPPNLGYPPELYERRNFNDPNGKPRGQVLIIDKAGTRPYA